MLGTRLRSWRITAMQDESISATKLLHWCNIASQSPELLQLRSNRQRVRTQHEDCWVTGDSRAEYFCVSIIWTTIYDIANCKAH